jgi:hypothetical protein
VRPRTRLVVFSIGVSRFSRFPLLRCCHTLSPHDSRLNACSVYQMDYHNARGFYLNCNFWMILGFWQQKYLQNRKKII